jgi:hypothetical protein
VFDEKSYEQYWANHSTVFLFKPSNYVQQNGTEVEWLQRLIQLEARYGTFVGKPFIMSHGSLVLFFLLYSSLLYDWRMREKTEDSFAF